MFRNTREGLALALPAAIFSTLLFLVPVGILLSEAFRSGGRPFLPEIGIVLDLPAAGGCFIVRMRFGNGYSM